MSKEEKEEAGKEGDGHGAATPGKSKKKLIIIIAVVVLLIGGGGGFFMMSGKTPEEGHGEGAEAHEEEAPHLATAELPSFIVNLSETTNFLKVKLLLEYDPAILEKGAGHAKEGGGGGGHDAKGAEGLPGPLAARQPMIQDAVIKVLSAKKAADVLTLEGKETIKEELVEAINEASGLEEPPIVAVYFMEFIVQ